MSNTMASMYVPVLPSPLELAGRVVLLATDGTRGSAGALHIALALEAEHAAVVHVVHVVDTRSIPLPPPLGSLVAIGNELGGPAIHEEQIRELRAALSLTAGHPIEWPTAFLIGVPASAIVAEAQRLGAALIVVGLNHHGSVARAVSGETAHKVMQRADCPVLGIVPSATRLPTRALVAVDFSRTSLLASQAARAVVGRDAKLALAYVAPSAPGMPDDGELILHKLGLETAFARTVHALAGRVHLDHVVLHREPPRDPAEIILEYADSTESDLIAAGSARHGRLDRWMLGSVSTGLVHDGRRSVLIVPPAMDAA